MRKAFIAVLMCAGALVACNKKNDNVIVQDAPPSDAGGAEVNAPAPTETAQAPAADEAATPAAEVAAPTGKPVRKAGLWQITSTGQGGGTTTLCVSNATEASQRGNVFATLGGGGRGGPGGQRPGGQRPGGGNGPGANGGGGNGGGGQGGGDGRGFGGGQGGPGGAGGGRGPGGGQGFGGGGGFGGGANPACQPKVAKAGDGWTSTSSCTIERGDTSIKMASKLTLTGDLSTSYTIKGSRTTPGGANPVSVTATYKGPCPSDMKPGDLKGPNGTRNVLQGRGGGGPRQG